jgi:Putative prokaryotic signal transducing protein
MSDVPADQNPTSQTPQVLNYASHVAEQLVVVARFSNSFEAGLAQSKLEAEGISTFPENAMVTGIDAYTGAQGTRLRVRREDAHRAAEILRATPARKFLVGEFAVVEEGAATCPACGSGQVARVPLPDAFKLLSIVLLGLPLLFAPKVWRCAACGNVWRDGPS